MSFLDPVFSPLLKLDPLWAVLIVSFVVSLLITIIYKYTTNQTLMKQLKGEMKDFQKQMKELRSQPQEMMKIQKQAMQTNMKYMMHSMRSTLVTFVPIILIFGWMNANLAYEPIHPNQQFATTLTFAEGSLGEVTLRAPDEILIEGDAFMEISNNEITYLLSSDSIGEYLLEFEYNNEKHSKDVKISDEQEFAPVIKKIKKSNLKTIQIGNNPMKVLNLFGWKVGWIGTYIIFSILFSIGLRKLFKLH